MDRQKLGIGPLYDAITWYKITHAVEQVAQWDVQNNAPAFVLEVPPRNLLTNMCDFVPCDRIVQRDYCKASHTSPPRPAVVLVVPLCNFRPSMCGFALCDRIMKRAYQKNTRRSQSNR